MNVDIFVEWLKIPNGWLWCLWLLSYGEYDGEIESVNVVVVDEFIDISVSLPIPESFIINDVVVDMLNDDDDDDDEEDDDDDEEDDDDDDFLWWLPESTIAASVNNCEKGF